MVKVFNPARPSCEQEMDDEEVKTKMKTNNAGSGRANERGLKGDREFRIPPGQPWMLKGSNLYWWCNAHYSP